MAKVPRVNTCCFCATLEAGCKIIGFVQVIFGAISFIGSIVTIIGNSGSKDHNGSIIGIGGTEVVISAVTFILGACLLMGIYKQKPALVKLWIWVGLVILILDIIRFIWCLFFVSGLLASIIVGAIFQAYFLVVVYSYYCEMTGENTG